MAGRSSPWRTSPALRDGGVFIVLNQQSGALTYVNAGHNAPVLTGTSAVTTLGACSVG